MRFSKLLVMLSLVAKSLSLFAQTNPDLEWKTLNTAHFEIIFDSKLYELAKDYAFGLELNYSYLSTALKETPNKTVVIINDNTDAANGYATYIPYPHIMVFPSLPGPGDSIGEYGDWTRELTLHEYTHILNFQPARGVVKVLRNVFGNIMVPNMLLPRWWSEGIAVELETRFTNNGRLRSIYQDASIRALVLSERWNQFSPPEMAEQSISSWPKGSRPYLFGSLMMSELFDNDKLGLANDLNQIYGGRFPFIINSPFEDLTGKDYETHFAEMMSNTKDKVEQQLDILRKVPTTPFVKFDFPTNTINGPAMSPDNRYIALVATSDLGESSVKVLDRQNESRPFDPEKDNLSGVKGDMESPVSSGPPLPSKLEDDAPPSGTIERISWFPSSDRFLYDRVHEINPVETFSDLYTYDVLKKKNKKITDGFRAREPDLSPDGARVVFVHLEGGQTSLWTSDTEGTQKELLFTPPRNERLSYPTFINNEKIIFAWRKKSGDEPFVIDLKNKGSEPMSLKVLNSQFKNLKETNFFRRTEKGVLFAANENGLRNIYLLNSTNFRSNNSLTRLTHFETTAFASDWDLRTKELLSVIMTENGPDLVRSKEENLAQTSDPLPQISPIFESRYPAQLEIPDKHQREEAFKEQVNTEAQDYSPLGYLIPQYWFPNVYSTDNGLGFEASTSGFDPLGRHMYVLQAQYDPTHSQRGFAFQYDNKTTWWDIETLATTKFLLEPMSKQDYTDTLAGLRASHDLWNLSESLSAGMQFLYGENLLYSRRYKFGPGLFVDYGEITKSPYHYTANSGWQVHYSFQKYLENHNADQNTSGNTQVAYDESQLSAVYYYSKGLPKKHVLKAELHGQYIPQQITTLEATQSTSFPMTANLLSSGFVMRGYDSGYFLMQSAVASTLEYRFPMVELNKGSGMKPFFLRNLSGTVFVDALTADGKYYDVDAKSYSNRSARMNKYFFSTGTEAKLSTTIGFHLPMTFVLGFYYRPEYTSNNKGTLFLGLQI